MKTKVSSKKSIITFTPGRLYRIKLRGKRQAKGILSLYLDYYFGVSKTQDGKTKTQRKFEFLNLYILDNPTTTEERQQKKQNLELALKIRSNREDDLINNKEGLLSKRKRNINFIDYCQAFYENYTNKDIRLVKSCLRKFNEFVGKKYLAPSEVTKELIINFKAYLLDNLNGDTPNNYFKKFRMICLQATKERIFLNNPAENIFIPQSDGLKKEILSFNEIQLLTNAKCGNPEIKLAFLFCLNTGLRHIDIKTLKWENIDFENNQLRKMQTKVKHTSKAPFVYIDLNNNTKSILGCLTKGNPNELVFTLPSITSSLKTLKIWAKKAGIVKNITWHSARHSFATNLLVNNANIKTVSSLLGHSSLKYTEKYTHLIDELKTRAVNSLPDIQLENNI